MCIGRDAGVSTRHKLNSSNVSTRSLRFLSYSGKGLVTKLDIPIFGKRFSEFEIVVVTETWRTMTHKLSIANYWDFSQT